tara:strand:- start:9 stop:1622 length:1614 start_codon:yes stop_codon:yes gene_type:complete
MGKWIGQHIFDLVAKFRSDVYLTNQSALYSGEDGLGDLTIVARDVFIKNDEVDSSGDTTSGDPTFRIGSSDTECLQIASNYQTSTKSMQIAQFATKTESSTPNDGRFRFLVDQVSILEIDDGGIDFFSGFAGGISFNGTDVLTDNGSGRTTLANIDALDATTISTISSAVSSDINHDSLEGFVTAEHVDWASASAGTIHSTNIPTLNQNTTGQAGTVATIAGLAPNTATTAASQPNITSLGTLTALTVGGDLTVNGDTITFESTAANDPTITIQNTTDDTNSPRLRFFKRREDGGTLQAGEDGDGVGEILFNSFDDNSPTPGGTNYAKIEGFIHDATNGQESGQLKLQVASHDGGVETGILLTGGSVDTEVDVTIGNGTASATTIAGDLNMAATGAIFRAGIPNIFGSVIKLIPSDFMANDDGGNTKFGVGYVETPGAGYGMRTANNATELYAFVSIPEGMKATHVDIFDKNDLAVEVFEAQINATTMTSKGSGNANTTIDITDVNSTATNFLVIEVTTTSATNDKVYGGQVTIASI